MEVWQGLIVAVTGLIGLYVATGWYILNRVKTLEKDNEVKRQAEIKDKNAQIIRLEGRLTKAEEQAAKVPGLESQVATMTRSIDDLLEFKEKAEKQLQEKDATIERQAAEIDRLKDQGKELFEANKALQIENRTYQKSLVFLGIERSEMRKISTDDLTKAAAKVAPTGAESDQEQTDPETKLITSEEKKPDGTE